MKVNMNHINNDKASAQEIMPGVRLRSQAAESQTAEKKPPKKKKNGAVSIILLILFLCSLSMCLFLIYIEVDKEIGIQDMETDIQEFVRPQAVPTPSADKQQETNAPNDSAENDAGQEPAATEPAGYVFDWEGLMSQSQYVVGWLQIPGIERINYPIVQHPDDNQFFLTHDWKGNDQAAGAIFMNVNNTPDFTDMNTVVYGHRMKSGSMFGMLKQYESQEFLDENPYFYIYTPDGSKLTYEAICYSHVHDGSDAYLMYFASPAERDAYYKIMLDAAFASRDVELGSFDSTVMLSTCDKDTRSDYYARNVLLGKLIEVDLDGQTEQWTDMEE